jgi:very-short-patch-repair endonuclease/predicted transcriptional regulator of viral defense system
VLIRATDRVGADIQCRAECMIASRLRNSCSSALQIAWLRTSDRVIADLQCRPEPLLASRLRNWVLIRATDRVVADVRSRDRVHPKPTGTPDRLTLEEFVLTRATDRLIADIAGRQNGLVTRAQLLAAGAGPDAVRFRVRARRLVPVQRGVYRVGPLPMPREREMAALLACGPGAAISHWSAAALQTCGYAGGTLPQLSPGAAAMRPVDVTITGVDRGHRPGICVHRVSVLGAREVTVLDGIAVTSVARTIFDLASEAGSGELQRMLAVAERESPAIRVELLDMLGQYRRRSGVRVLRALLTNDAAPAFTRSDAEERMLRLIGLAQLPRPEVNVRVATVEVDFLWRAEGIVVEVDGYAFHSSRARFENDRRRDAGLAALGIRVIRVTWRQLVAEPEAVLVRLARTLCLAAVPAPMLSANPATPASYRPARTMSGSDYVASR